MGLGIKTRFLRCWYLVFRYRLASLRWRFLRDTSQHGEYWVLRRMIDATVPRFFVDVGANDGLRHSNSYPFIQLGWSAVLVEPNPQVFQDLRTRYRDNPNVRTINCACGQTEGVLPLFLGQDGEIGEFATLAHDAAPHDAPGVTRVSFAVKVRPLTEVLEQCNSPSQIGVLSVDTEGYDYQVFLGLDFYKFRPRFIITEDQSADDPQKFDLLHSHGYRLRRRIGVNSIWSDRRR